MRRYGIVVGILCLGSGFAAGAVAESSPTVTANVPFFECEQACANIIGGKPLRAPPPSLAALSLGVEGHEAVRLRYTVFDGKVSDVNILNILGARSYADRVVEKVKQWTFEPAKRDGTPIRQAGETSWSASTKPPGYRRPEIIQAYSGTVASLDGGDLGKAEAILNTALSLPHLTLDEKAALANLAAPIMLRKGDFADAYDLVFLTTELPGGTPQVLQRNLLMFRIQADAGLGNAADMARTLQKYRAAAGNDAKADFVAKTEQQLAQLDALEAITFSTRLPPADIGEGVRFELYRRHFKIQNVTGRLERLSLDCVQSGTDYDLAGEMDWHVPPDARPCWLFVQGQPGTTFQVVEYKN